MQIYANLFLIPRRRTYVFRANDLTMNEIPSHRNEPSLLHPTSSSSTHVTDFNQLSTRYRQHQIGAGKKPLLRRRRAYFSQNSAQREIPEKHQRIILRRIGFRAFTYSKLPPRFFELQLFSR